MSDDTTTRRRSVKAKLRNGWVYRYWKDGHYAYQAQGDFDQLDIVRMFASLDPVVREALLEEVETETTFFSTR